MILVEKSVIARDRNLVNYKLVLAELPVCLPVSHSACRRDHPLLTHGIDKTVKCNAFNLHPYIQ